MSARRGRGPTRPGHQRKVVEPHPVKRIRHLKRGTTYVEIARGELQIAGEWELEEGDKIVLYRSEKDGKIWAREASEVDDPNRFEVLT
jgi:hypothetical protein